MPAGPSIQTTVPRPARAEAIAASMAASSASRSSNVGSGSVPAPPSKHDRPVGPHRMFVSTWPSGSDETSGSHPDATKLGLRLSGRHRRGGRDAHLEESLARTAAACGHPPRPGARYRTAERRPAGDRRRSQRSDAHLPPVRHRRPQGGRSAGGTRLRQGRCPVASFPQPAGVARRLLRSDAGRRRGHDVQPAVHRRRAHRAAQGRQGPLRGHDSATGPPDGCRGQGGRLRRAVRLRGGGRRNALRHPHGRRRSHGGGGDRSRRSRRAAVLVGDHRPARRGSC